MTALGPWGCSSSPGGLHFQQLLGAAAAVHGAGLSSQGCWRLPCLCPDVTVCAEGPSVRGAGTCGEQMGSSLPCGAHKQAENTDRDKPMDVCFVYLFIAIDRGETEVYRGRRRSFPHFAGEEAGSQERLVTRLNDTDSKWQGRMQTSQPIPSLCTHPIVHAGGASVSELLFPGKCSGGLPRGSRGRSHAKSGQVSGDTGLQASEGSVIRW